MTRSCGSAEDRSAAVSGAARCSLFCVDFDGTVTSQDTTRLLGLAAALHRGEAWSADTAQLPAAWIDLERQYMSERDAFFDAELSGSCAGSYDSDGLVDFVTRLQQAEERAVERVIEARALAGLHRERLVDEVPGRLRCLWDLRPQSVATISAACRSGACFAVISVGWSRELIAAVLSAGDLPEAMLPSGAMLRCNEVAFSPGGASATGEITQHVGGGAAKRAALQALRVGEAGDGLVCYVGDSVTDLLALLDADVGIVMGSSSSLLRVAQAFGVELRPLVHARGTESIAKGLGILYRTDSWAEIAAFFEWDVQTE